jgi:hypothetical protein
MERWICHEAGHITVALKLGFRVESVEIFQGKPRTMCELSAADRTDDERYVFLAGGVAGELSVFREYDRTARGSDQALITEFGGGSIDAYLPQASEILNSTQNFHGELKKRIKLRILERSLEGMILGSSNTFPILARATIEDLWNACW